VTINPGMILGPSLTPGSESGSLFLLDEMLKGYFFYGMPDLSLTTVDVREVAQAHVQAARREEAHGRYILAERQMLSFVDISKLLREVHHRPWLLPRHQIPDLLVRLIGPSSGSRRTTSASTWASASRWTTTAASRSWASSIDRCARPWSTITAAGPRSAPSRGTGLRRPPWSSLARRC
jgi:uncharacterized protein YbjT (DUF2867 family)